MIIIACSAGTYFVVSLWEPSAEELALTSQKEPRFVNRVGLNFFGFKADARNLIAIEDTLHDFMAANPDIFIYYESLKGQDYYHVLNLRNKANVLDDIFMLNHDTVVEFAAAGKLADLRYVENVDKFQKWIIQQFTNSDGSVYFLPSCISTYNLLINLDLLQEHKQAIPGNMQEFTSVCDYFKSLGITPIIANNYASLPYLITARSFFSIYQLEDSSAEIEKLNSDKTRLVAVLKPGFELVDLIIKHGWIDCEETLKTEQTSDDIHLFMEGKRPFIITGGWASARIKEIKPDLKFGIYPFPILDDGAVLNVNPDTCVAVSAKSKHLPEALRFISYWIMPDILWKYCDSQNSFSPMVHSKLPTCQNSAPLAAYLENKRYVLRMDYKFTIPLEDYLRKSVIAMLEGMDSDSALKMFDSLLTQYAER